MTTFTLKEWTWGWLNTELGGTSDVMENLQLILWGHFHIKMQVSELHTYLWNKTL